MSITIEIFKRRHTNELLAPIEIEKKMDWVHCATTRLGASLS